MTAVSQKISNFIGGISQQPIEKQLPGSVKDALNVVPDVKGILGKRPGSSLVSTLSDDVEGKWHNYYRDDNEQYFIRVRPDGQVDVWDALTGSPKLVKYDSIPYNVSDEERSYVLTGYYGPWSNATTPPSEPLDTGNYWVWTGADNTQLGSAYGPDVADITVNYGDRIAWDTLNPDSDQDDTFFIIKNGSGKVPICYSCLPDEYISGQIAVQSAREALNINKGRSETINYRLQTEELTPQERADLEAELVTLTQALPSLIQTYEDALNAFEPMGSACGIYNNPYSKVLKSTTTCDPTNALPYLKHDKDSDIQMTTINDFTFVVNRNKETTMAGGVGSNDDKSEAYFYINQIAYEQTYSINYWDADPDNNSVKEITQATALRLATSSQTDSNQCDGAVFSQTYEVSGVKFRLDVVRYSVAQSNPEFGVDEYDCKWDAYLYWIATNPTIESPSTGSVLSTISALGRNWTIIVNATTTNINTADAAITAGPYDAGSNLSGNKILADMVPGFEALGLTAEIIGNGIYLTKDAAFTIDTTEGQLLTAISSQVNNVSELPTQCKNGFSCKVVNSFSDEDDYYVQFQSQDNIVDSGSGTWVETVAPNVQTIINWNTMPHAVRRETDGTFCVSPIRWGDREVGDDITNPEPSFIGQKINKIIFFRNRFVVLAGENVIFSRTNLFYDFFGATAKTVLDSDPIDLLTSSTYPAVLYDAIETTAGLVLLADSQQFLCATDNTDLFSPRTAVIKSIGSYGYNQEVRPVHMGQTIGFVNNAGIRSRFFELLPSRDLDYKAVETSKPVDRLVPKDINLICDSKDDNMIAFAQKQSTGELDDTSKFVWIYRFFDQGDKRVQSAWFKWKLSDHILFHAIMNDCYYAVLRVETGNPDIPTIAVLQKFELKLDEESLMITVGPEFNKYEYQVHMDNYIVITPSEITYDKQANISSFLLPIGYLGDNQLVAYELEIDSTNENGYVVTGRTGPVTTTGVTKGVEATLQGDWDGINNIVCGYNFDMSVKMPTIFLTKTTGESVVADTTGYLNIHRAVLDFEATGIVDARVERLGREDYVISNESTIEDGYIADSVAVNKNSQRSIPLYSKNVQTEIYIESTHPTPVNLVSMTWQGDYSKGNYTRA